MFVRTAGAADTPLTRAATRGTLVAAVLRTWAEDSAPPHDYVLLLVSDAQGVGKSLSVRSLIAEADRDRWFSESLDLSGSVKEQHEQIGTAVIVECSELGGLSRTELERLKSFVTRQQSRFRPAYGRRSRSVPARFVVIATANNRGSGVIPHDPTGGRRWAIAPCVGGLTGDEIVSYYDAHRDQIWAEAVAAAAAGETGLLPPELWAERDRAVAAHDQRNYVAEDIAAWLDGQRGMYVDGATVSRLIEDSTGERPLPGRTYLHRELPDILHRLGWRSGADLGWRNNQRRRLWYPPGDPVSVAAQARSLLSDS